MADDRTDITRKIPPMEVLAVRLIAALRYSAFRDGVMQWERDMCDSRDIGAVQYVLKQHGITDLHVRLPSTEFGSDK